MELNTPYMDMNRVGLDGKDDYLKMMSYPDQSAFVSPKDEYIKTLSVGSSTQLTTRAYLSVNSPPDDSTQDNPRFQYPSSSPSPSAPRKRKATFAYSKN